MDSSLAHTETISTVPTKQSSDPTVNRSNLSPPTTENNPSTAVLSSETHALKKNISTHSFCVLAISGSIGAGLLIASGSALQSGGPGSLVLAFAIVGGMVWCVMLALGELSATFPVQGSFYDYSVRFISESWGFAMGWNYVLNWMLIVAFEVTVMLMVARWFLPVDSQGVVGSGVIAILPGCFLVLVFIQAFGSRGYGEAEYVFGILKVLVLMVFIVTAIVVASGGTKEAGGRGFENWQKGQAFLNGLPGFLSVFAAAGLAFGGTEMLGLAAAECRHPRKVMPLGAMLVIVRILLCYILPLLMVGFVLSPSAFALPGYQHLHIVSPFVLAIDLAGLRILSNIINAVLLVSVFSMANASCFATSRAMVSISRKGMGTKLLAKVSERGVPWPALAVVFVGAQLAWIAILPNGQIIFDWLLCLTSISNYFTWISICVCHLRMRSAMKAQGCALNDLKWKSPLGLWGSYLAIVLLALCMVAQASSAILPSVLPTDDSRVALAVRGILGFGIVLLFYGGHILFVARKQTDKSWREKLWIPMEMLVLPELGAWREPRLESVRDLPSEKRQQV